jgi:transcriptional regulator with XRE-family HTH domain
VITPPDAPDPGAPRGRLQPRSPELLPPELLAERITRLFDEVRKPMSSGERRRYTLEEVAAGTGLSTGFLSQLRNGTRQDTTVRRIQALADFFDVDVEYFFASKRGDQIAEELALIGALRGLGATDLLLRMANLPPEQHAIIREVIAALERHSAKRD